MTTHRRRGDRSEGCTVGRPTTQSGLWNVLRTESLTAPRTSMQRVTLASALYTACLLSVSQAIAQLGMNYCTANPNSTGSRAEMSASGTTRVVLNDLTLGCSSLPQGSVGYFLVSRFQGFVGLPTGSSGNLCLGAPIGRYLGTVLSAGPAGVVGLPVDLTQVPDGSATFAVAPGDTRNPDVA